MGAAGTSLWDCLAAEERPQRAALLMGTTHCADVGFEVGRSHRCRRLELPPSGGAQGEVEGGSGAVEEEVGGGRREEEEQRKIRLNDRARRLAADL